MQYTVSGTDCCLISTERIRIGADGSVGIGGGDTVIERYPFKTAEVAQICANIFNRDAAKHAASGNFYFTPQGSAVANQFQTYFKSANKIIARWDHTGVLVELDLPYITWIWLRTTAPVRLIKALWRGWA